MDFRGDRGAAVRKRSESAILAFIERPGVPRSRLPPTNYGETFDFKCKRFLTTQRACGRELGVQSEFFFLLICGVVMSWSLCTNGRSNFIEHVK